MAKRNATPEHIKGEINLAVSEALAIITLAEAAASYDDVAPEVIEDAMAMARERLTTAKALLNA